MRHKWTLDDLLDAHITLDIHEQLEAKLIKQAEQQANTPKHPFMP